MKFRIFSNDRGTKNGVPLYSALMDVNADTPDEALKKAPLKWGQPPYAPMVAIEWPAFAEDNVWWLNKHVNVNDGSGRKR